MDGCAIVPEDGASAAGLNLGFQVSKSRVKGKGIATKAKRSKPHRGNESSNFSFDDFNLYPSDDDKRKSDKENRDKHGEGSQNEGIASTEHKSPSKNDVFKFTKILYKQFFHTGLAGPLVLFELA